MRRISPFVVAVLASFSFAAAAQDSPINKSDLPDPRSSIDQAPVSVGDPTPQAGTFATTTRTRITNASSVATDSSTGARTQGAQQNLATGGGPARPAAPSVFQKFLHESTGRNLPIFGAEFFANAPSTFAPVTNTPVPADYPLGPGDEVLIRGWGSVDIDYRATVDRNGLINIPTIGAIVLGGVKAGDVESVVRGAVAKLYKGVTLNVNFGQLRAITVYVVGQAARPGTYTVSNMSTLVTTLFASGGPNANGSMRRVQVKRGGKVVAELDLYAFIAKGDKSADIKLQDGDTIYILPAQGYVALVGMVNSPAIYELRGNGDTIASLIDYAGGLPIVADPRRAFLERIDPKTNQPRTVEQFALDAAGVAKVLKNGDLLNITSITPDFGNAVVLRGSVDQSVRAPFKAGMRVSDLIPSRAYLMTRASIRRQNSAANESENQHLAGTIGNSLDPINWDYAVVERVSQADLSVNLIPFNLGKVFENPSGPDNVQLQPGDTVTIFSQNDVRVPLAKQRVFVRVEGEVNTPGVYQMTPGETVQGLLARAGGPTGNAYLFGTAFYRERAKQEQAENLVKIAARLESQIRNEQARSLANTRTSNTGDLQVEELRRMASVDSAKIGVDRLRQLKPTGRVTFGMDARERSFNRLPALKLEDGDVLVIPPRPDFVHVFGAVHVESSVIWRPGFTVDKYLQSAGITRDADRENIFVMRVDGSVLSSDSGSWFRGGVGGVEVMPGDAIVVPEKVDKETGWTRFVGGVKEWSQILANFGLGAAAIKVLR